MKAYNRKHKPKHYVKHKWHKKFYSRCSKKIGKAGTFFIFAYTHTIEKYKKIFFK